MNFFDKLLKCKLGLKAFNEFSTVDGFVNYINWWDINNPEEVWFSGFLRTHVNLRKKINFYSVFGNSNYLKRRVGQEITAVNIFYTGENVSSTSISNAHRAYGDHMLSCVDISLGFDDYINDPKYFRFPLWLMYVFSPDSTYEDVKKKVEEINTRESNIQNRYIDCSIISRHDSNGIRTRVCDSLSDFFSIKYEGRWRNNSNLLRDKYNDNKVDYLSHVKFNICPENSNYPGYVTEKIFEAFLARTVPIYWGGGMSPEKDILNQEAFIYWDDSNDCYEKINRLHCNKKEYIDFISQPVFKDGADERIWDYFQGLKERIEFVLDEK